MELLGEPLHHNGHESRTARSCNMPAPTAQPLRVPMWLARLTLTRAQERSKGKANRADNGVHTCLALIVGFAQLRSPLPGIRGDGDAGIAPG
jgi:hypothetical protein